MNQKSQPVFIRIETHKKLKIKSAKEGVPMSKIVEKALKVYFEGKY